MINIILIDEVIQTGFDLQTGRFFSTVGFDNRLLSALCSGMSPISSLGELCFQVCGIINS